MGNDPDRSLLAMLFRHPLKVFLLFLLLQHESSGALFPKVWDVPAENPHFVGRKELLQEISNIFKTSPVKVAVISGFQGFGKSQTAKRYVYQNFVAYDVVWWFRANQYLKPQFEKFALAVALSLLNLRFENVAPHIGHLTSLIKVEIRRKNLRCLMVFDDAQDYAEIEPYLLFSHDKNVHILITTKNSDFSAQSIKIKPFSCADSIEYIDHFLSHESQKAKKLLAIRSQGCPAALAIAIDYIKSYPGMTIERYLDKHKQHKSFPVLAEFMKKLGSPVDGYEKDLSAAIQMNMLALHKTSEEAFLLVGLLSLLHRDSISFTFVEDWLKVREVKTDVMDLVHLINKYSLIEISQQNKRTPISMQELIQSIVSSLIPLTEKRRLINEATSILKNFFISRSDKIVESMMQNNSPLLHAIKLSEEADQIDHHHYDLTFIRLRALNAVMGNFRDPKSAQALLNHLSNDLAKKVSFSQEDQILYNVNLSMFAGLYGTGYEEAIAYGNKALAIAESMEGTVEERIRIISNLIQYYAFSGFDDECSTLIKKGEELFQTSQSTAYNALYIFATTLWLIDQGAIEKTIQLCRQYQHLWEKQNLYPLMSLYILNQLAEALIKNKEFKEAKSVLTLAQEYGEAFYGDDQDNSFFNNLKILKAMLLSIDSRAFPTAKSLLDDVIRIQEKIYQGWDKNRNQAFAHLQLGKLFHSCQQYDQAKNHYFKSEAIFDKTLKNKRIDDVSELYKHLAVLGVDTKDEVLAHTYIKKQIATFDLNHPRTKEIMVYLTERGLVLPF